MNLYHVYPRQWFSFSFENPDLVTGNHAAVYLWNVELNNRLGWVKKFSSPTSQAMAASGIKSYNTYKKVFDQLVGWGFIEVIQASQNQFSSNIIALSIFDRSLERSLDESLNKSLTNHLINQSEITGQITSSIIKPIDKETNKPINIDFVVFWDLYGNKKDRDKSEAKWNKLTDEERAQAIEDIPKYIDSLDNRKYQKNPLTYLNGKCWKDEREVIPLPSKQKITREIPDRLKVERV